MQPVERQTQAAQTWLSGVELWLIQAVPRLLEAALIGVGTVLVLRVVRSWLARALDRSRIDPGTRILVVRSTSIALAVVGAVAVLGTLGVDPTALAAVVGVAGLALSLAIQDILKNFFSGVYLLLERPFRVGDVIKVKDQQGIVEHIGVRTTALRTVENVQVLVPNAIVFAEVVANQTHARPAAPAEPAGPLGAAEAQPEAGVTDRR